MTIFDQMIDQTPHITEYPDQMNFAALTAHDYRRLTARQDALIDALEQTETPPIEGKLRYGKSMCVLGITCELYRQLTGIGTWTEVEGVQSFSIRIASNGALTNDPAADGVIARSAELPYLVSEYFGLFGGTAHARDCLCLRCPCPPSRINPLPSLMALNDFQHKPFPIIAAYLRRYRHHYMTTKGEIR